MALFGPQYFKTLVAVGGENKKKFQCYATGFLIGFIARKTKDPSKKLYYAFLITNRHVFEDKEYISLRFNKKNGKTRIFRQSLFFPNKETKWLAHPNKKVDIALLNINTRILYENEIDFKFFPEELFAYYNQFEKIGIETGDEVYVLGFPLGMAGVTQNYPCLKWGIISRLDRELKKEQKSFFIDSSIFPGNSGSPVISKPPANALTGTKIVSAVYLLGLVKSYIPYEEALYTHQTKPYTVVSLSRENSGLASVIPMDFARQIFKRWKTKKKRLEKAQEQIQSKPSSNIVPIQTINNKK